MWPSVEPGAACAWVGVVAMGLLGGCGAESPVTGRPLSLGAFSNQGLVDQQRPSVADADAALIAAGFAPGERDVRPARQSESMDSFFDVTARVDNPVVVDSLIGQVNGRPIYADEVLAPLIDRLQADYDQLPYRDFQQRLTELVLMQLNEVVINELIVAESRASLTQDQQGGLMHFMDQLREEAIGKRGGVMAEAQQRLLEEEGKTIEEYLEDEQQKMLIGKLLSEKISPHTLVSWRDIERAYRARRAEFQPTPTVTLGRIRIRTEGHEEQISLITGELAAGEPFAVVARQGGIPDDGVWETFDLPAGGLEDLELAAFYKPHLKGLGPGDVSSAFERGPWTIWVSVIDIHRPKVRSLEDPGVQRQLQEQLAAQRGSEAEGEFIHDVLQRGIYDDIARMSQRTVAIAASRFPPK